MLRVIDFTGRAKEEHRLDIPDPKAFIEKQFNTRYPPEISYSGVYRNMGWMYDFRPYLNRYVVCQYNSWQAYYCLNKTLLRKLIPGKVQEIVQVKNSN